MSLSDQAGPRKTKTTAGKCIYNVSKWLGYKKLELNVEDCNLYVGIVERGPLSEALIQKYK